MVKFGRKFFFDRVHTKKNYTIPIIIGSVLLVAIITTFLVTRYYKNDKPKKVEYKVVLKDKVEIEIYNEFPKTEEFIKEIKNLDISDLKITYPEELKISEDTSGCETENSEKCKKQIVTSLGEYKITVKSDKLKKDNTVTLNVVDNTAPELSLKEITITEGETYTVNDFINTCTDNSKTECSYEFYNEDKDEDGNIIDYSKYTKPGTYNIKVIAKDSSNNKSEAIGTKLTINKKKEIINTKPNNNSKPSNNTKPSDSTSKTESCKYGDLKYSNSYVLALKVSNTKCAISVEESQDLGNKDATNLNKIYIKEIQKAYLQNTLEPMNLAGQMTYEIDYGPVFNTSNKGIVGYYILSEAKQTIEGKTTTIARYYLNENGNRVWKINALNLK